MEYPYVGVEGFKMKLQRGYLEKYAWWLAPIVIGATLFIIGGFLSPYALFIATSWIAFGLVAFALDIVWGKGGDLSLGHTTFFGLGGYLYGVVAIN